MDGRLRVVLGTLVAAGLGIGVSGAVLGAGWLTHRSREGRPLAERLPNRAHAAEDRPARPGRRAPAPADAPSPAGGPKASAAAPAAAPTAAPTAPAPAPTASRIGADGLPLRFELGINEAISVPQKALREGKIGRDALASHLDRDAERANGLGARFVRGNSGAFPRNSWWSHANEPNAKDDTDTWVRAVQKGGFEPVLMVSPWPGNRTANHTERYVPDDMAAYTAWVTAVVERYDGDGVDDMPGLLAPIRYWEIDNEPDLKFTTPPRDAVRKVAPGSFCAPKEHATVLLATSKAIRAAYPDARILNGGIYRPFADNGQTYLRELLAVPGVSAAFDILSLHSYASDEDGDAYARGLAAARQIAGGKPIFVTETSVASEGEKRWMSPEWQARMVALAAARGAAAGARVVMWHTLADPPPESKLKSGFERHSLFTQVADGRFTGKPAAAVYRNLAARLAEDDLTGATEDGSGAVRLRSGAALLYAGERSAKNGGLNLTNGQKIAPGATASAPAWLWP